MKPMKTVFFVLCTVLLASLAYAQPAIINVAYNPSNPLELLGSPCDAATRVPYVAGTVNICVYWDRDGDGPEDTDLQPDIGTEYGQVNWQCQSLPYDGFFDFPEMLVINSIPDTGSDHPDYFLRIGGGGVCWQSTTFEATPGNVDLEFTYANWTCLSTTCPVSGVQPNPPTNFHATVDTKCMEVVLTWQHDRQNIAGFHFWQDGIRINREGGPADSSFVVSVTNNLPHYYRATAYNASFESVPTDSALGHTYLVEFADGAAGDISGYDQAGTLHHIQLRQPLHELPCPYGVKIYLLRDTSSTFSGRWVRQEMIASDSLRSTVDVLLPNDPTRYELRLLMVDSSFDYQVTFTDTTASRFHLGPFTAVDPNGNTVPNVFSLEQNYPNPFNPETQISFNVPIQAQVRIQVYNVMGQMVRTLAEGSFSPGIHQLTWDSRSDNGVSLSAGIYFYRMEGPGFVQTKKMLLLK
jgi:hypothetical protein